MKKYVIMLVAMFTMSIGSFAEENMASKVENAKMYELNVNQNKLASALDLSKDQMESVDFLIEDLKKGVLFAYSMESDESKYKILHNAITSNMKNMHCVLNSTQYKKYALLLNLTLKNRGFDICKIVKNY